MGAGIKVKQGGKEETSVNQLISGLISFVWLWETSRELAQEKVEFHKIMQTAVICMTLIQCMGTSSRRITWIILVIRGMA